jgi:hypothetical protein
MREKGHDAAGQSKRKGRWVYVLVSNIPTLIRELPHPKLALEPFLRRQAVDVAWLTLTGSQVSYRYFPPMKRILFEDNPRQHKLTHLAISHGKGGTA